VTSFVGPAFSAQVKASAGSAVHDGGGGEGADVEQPHPSVRLIAGAIPDFDAVWLVQEGFLEERQVELFLRQAERTRWSSCAVHRQCTILRVVIH